MRIVNGTVEFEYMDMHFVEKVGLIEATDMVLDYKSVNKTPFIYDTYQLANLLGIRRRTLFLLSKNAEQYYCDVAIKKRDGGERKLCVPDPALKMVQRAILKHILDKLPVSKYATAYHEGAKLLDNAIPHCAKKYVLKMDLKDFFGSITFMQVYSAAFNTHYFPKQIGTMLTQLCCKDDVLPQGAPSSPMLSNLVMKNFDENFGAWCKEKGFDYTRYCDDITVSGDTSLAPAYRKAKWMLTKMGFEINEKKTHFISNCHSQNVTGLTVNEFARVPSQYRRKLRQQLSYVFRYGLADSMKHCKAFELKEGEREDSAAYRYLNSLMGQVNYVLQIEPDNEYFVKARDRLLLIYENYNLFKYFEYYNYYG